MLDKKILEMKEEIIKSVQESVKIKSVEEEAKEGMPFGEGVHKALQNCLNLSKSLGFKTVNVDNMIGYAEYGEGDEMVAVLGHLDVVPEGDGWTYPPYAAEIHEGKIYGRGTTDDKGPTIGALYALKAIKDLNLPLKRRVRVIFGLNEETGSNCVKHYVEKGEEIPVAGFTPDSEYPIINAEKGIVTCKYKRSLNTEGDIILKSIRGGIAPNVVPDYSEAVVYVDNNKLEHILELAKDINGIKIERKEDSILIKSFGISAHGSTPQKGKNAISHLLLFLGKLDFKGDIKEFIDFMNEYIGFDLEGRKLGIYLEDDISGKFIFNLGTIWGNEEEISIEINMRYPVTKKYEDFIDNFKEKIDLGKMKEVYMRHKKSLYVPADTEFIKKLQKVYEEKMGEKAELIAIGGGTYAKAMENIVAFGPVFRGQPKVEHQPDEYIEIDSLIKNVQIMGAAIYELAK
ncbi:succinyl-diaminopimelate desuccinylase [Clostridium tetanomorphum]|nr:dipeptidase PepV [Clostridium tetanomorphum]KAJ50612.1 dipeptidase PepV [Clostridium tetanomorphum DSM 665]MBP1862687.1 succinyl-diaminopimelate desuccinylase [Clostridium tetanomorphum]NRS85473.1 succinyl-diaminopimelate desuccinylase [Clostridium tetanomorphum]NRZ98587.1 succinyl-diaminopimelate desuccinylase [Clostridium tetanomorphum]SQC02810.1 dipeptidase, putative [Clostridium tetanomorphum]